MKIRAFTHFQVMLSLAVEVEKAVQNFPRYHKYTLGSELRGFCHDALGLIAEANSTVNRGQILMQLRFIMERLKIHLMLAKEVQAFNRARYVGWALPTNNLAQ